MARYKALLYSLQGKPAGMDSFQNVQLKFDEADSILLLYQFDMEDNKFAEALATLGTPAVHGLFLGEPVISGNSRINLDRVNDITREENLELLTERISNKYKSVATKDGFEHPFSALLFSSKEQGYAELIHDLSLQDVTIDGVSNKHYKLGE